jgi:hypothetical protein
MQKVETKIISLPYYLTDLASIPQNLLQLFLSFIDHDNYPGPGAYAPEHYPLMKETRQPSYTMGGCTPQHELQQTPGPNEYMIPSTIGSNMSDKQVAASYTM